MSFVAIAVGVSAVATVGSGYMAYQSGQAQQGLMEKQGQLQYEDSLREAKLITDEGYKFQQEQMMAYISSGVEIQGTPLLTLADTKAAYTEEAEYTVKSGKSQRSLSQATGKIDANEGKAALIGSIGQAVGSGVGVYGALK